MRSSIELLEIVRLAEALERRPHATLLTSRGSSAMKTLFNLRTPAQARRWPDPRVTASASCPVSVRLPGTLIVGTAWWSTVLVEAELDGAVLGEALTEASLLGAVDAVVLGTTAAVLVLVPTPVVVVDGSTTELVPLAPARWWWSRSRTPHRCPCFAADAGTRRTRHADDGDAERRHHAEHHVLLAAWRIEQRHRTDLIFDGSMLGGGDDGSVLRQVVMREIAPACSSPASCGNRAVADVDGRDSSAARGATNLSSSTPSASMSGGR